MKKIYELKKNVIKEVWGKSDTKFVKKGNVEKYNWIKKIHEYKEN